MKLIATRTRKPISYFLAESRQGSQQAIRARSRVLELQELCFSEDFGAAIELGLALLPELADPRDEAQARLCLGQAFIRSHDPEPAREHLAAAHSMFEELNDPWQLVECLNLEAGALYLKEDPRALEVAEEALRRCRQLDPLPTATELRILTNLAALHVTRHEWEQAISIYESAIQAADSLRDLRRMASMHSGMAVAYRNLGELSQAITHSDKALALHSVNRDSTARARLENNLGLLHLQQGQLDAAERHLLSSLRGFEEHGLEVGRVHTLLSLGELHVRRGDSDRAEEVLETALRLAESTGERMSLALAHMQLGRIHEAGRHRAKADRSFAAAIRLLAELGVTERLVECHTAYAEILERRGATRRALDHWKRAMELTRPGQIGAQPPAATATATERPA